MIDQHSSYLASWIKALKEDKKAIFKATSKARESLEYLTKSLTDFNYKQENIVSQSIHQNSH